VTDSSVTDPRGPDPAVSEPAVSEPAVSEPAVSDEPDTARDAATGEPVEGEPAEGAPTSPDPVRLRQLEREGEIAADYLEALLDIADLDGDLDLDVEGDRAMVAIEAEDLDVLVGPQGEVLEALQELTRLAVLRETGERSRLMLDVARFRATRRNELAALGRDAANEVRSSGQPKKLPAMTPFERKVVHDAVAAAGLRSESEGQEPQRSVVILPA
jgi:spoIIIJ-associated protein